MRALTGLGIAISVFALAACQKSADQNAAINEAAVLDNSGVPENAVAADNSVAPSASAKAALADAGGAARGEVTATDQAGGIAIAVTATGLKPGIYGIHIHSVGKCEGPKFESAGSHWNPTGKQHGTANPMGAHVGDLPNLTIGADGTGKIDFQVVSAAVASGANPLLDADGAAFMIHAKPDDYKTDPSGASGDRIVCGVFAAG